MKLLKQLFILLLFSSSVACQNKDRSYIVKVGDKAPVFKTKLANGDAFNLEDYRGKVIMLQFTASWCGVCHK
jgi:thiol-disulfide isomerase/thioredoxin